MENSAYQIHYKTKETSWKLFIIPVLKELDRFEIKDLVGALRLNLSKFEFRVWNMKGFWEPSI